MATKYPSDLRAAVAKRTGVDEAEIRRILSNVESQVIEWCAKGHKVQMTGFGTFDKGVMEFRPGADFERAME